MLNDAERNHRAGQALMGLVLVGGIFLMYLGGAVEDRLTRVVETLVVAEVPVE